MTHRTRDWVCKGRGQEGRGQWETKQALSPSCDAQGAGRVRDGARLKAEAAPASRQCYDARAAGRGLAAQGDSEPGSPPHR